MPPTLQTARRVAIFLGLVVALAGTPIVHAAEQTKLAAPRYVAKDMGWSLKLPKEENVVYQGVVSMDGAGLGAAPMLYSAPNIAGFFAAVITHGIILETTRSAQKARIQESANLVLLPYQTVLSRYTYRDLMQQALEKTATAGNKRLVEQSDKPGADLHIESLPVFSMTQDQSALVMDNAITIYAPGSPPTMAYQNIVRVVSRTESSTDPVNFWNANDGVAIKTESVRLLAESLDLALDEIAAGVGQDRPQRTVRYMEGNAEKMERGQVLKEQCNRVVLKNLRGWLMSVSVKPTAGGTTALCGDSAPPKE